ncbi:helix-turn-helix domain-containing protein [Aldersonia sp. NBC_00410]|uniref:PucR family transcriptional regulator n=1 Tax=Aldersonia sp. NBC_00410 TaxID=2975954 RepID=UPI0022561829|nr:helix-turn-helix domain-containing protein [Aldersonia sp. NBC_00410]MCX5042379.1 helix-turn-helix domain-containing protein [Aldersonia sp. NBC_00410]
MPHWAVQLTGKRAHGPELEWLGPDGGRVRGALGDGAVGWAVEVGNDIAERITADIPQLGEGVSNFNAIRRATTSTVLRALTLVCDLGGQHISLAGAEVVDIARDFARRGMELDDLLRSIRVGYAVLAAALLDSASALAPRAETTAEVRRISVLLFEELDEFTRAAAAAFLDEQSTWSASISAARLDLVEAILRGDDFDSEHTEQILGYSLDSQHLAVIAWTDETSRHTTGHDLRNVIKPVLRRWAPPTSTLIVPVGSRSIWAWAAIPGTPHPPQAPGLPEFEATHIVLGQPGTGPNGFRQSHAEARAVERVVRSLSSSTTASTTAHEDIDLEVLLLSDLEAARRFVERHLGRLAGTDPRLSELRTTLRHYLDLDHSLAKVAQIEHVSRNTVTYRVNQAMTLCAHPAGAPTTKLRVALTISSLLGH